MVAKAQIIDELGERALLLPQQVEQALAANDRVKFYLTLLQSAESHADHPDGAAPDLAAEREAAGAPSGLEQAMQSARGKGGGIHIPGAQRLRGLILADIAAMRSPLALIGAAQAEALAEREQRLAAALPDFSGDDVAAGIIGAMTSADRSRGDSLHILVMDLHKAINALQGEFAEESIDGARVWRIAAEDKPLVRAFMAGLNQTASLKFDHPGLGTTATRAGEKLVIQNDIGTTDAHVLVLHVEGLTATLTYTDVHAQRAAFFQSLFKPFGVTWDDTRQRQGEHLAEDATYYLCIGHFTAQDRQGLERYLAYLGSRIVFLIDWNRARKRLREFLRKGDPARLLKWAADHNVGQRGFLKLGGERLIYEALEFAQQAPLRYGEKLYETLGPEVALDYMKFVLRAATEGLLQGRSERFIRDEIQAELARRFHSAQEGLLSIATGHATLIFELASSLRDTLLRASEESWPELLAKTARRARQWEKDADALVSRMRAVVRRTRKPTVFEVILSEADNAADGLEEAAFLLTLLPNLQPADALVEPLRSLAALLVEGAQETIKMLEAASHVHREGARDDLQDFLEAVERIVAIEHETDDVERDATRRLILGAADFRALHLLSKLAGALEGAADGLSHSALKLRDHLLNDVMAG